MYSYSIYRSIFVYQTYTLGGSVVALLLGCREVSSFREKVTGKREMG